MLSRGIYLTVILMEKKHSDPNNYLIRYEVSFYLKYKDWSVYVLNAEFCFLYRTEFVVSC